LADVYRADETQERQPLDLVRFVKVLIGDHNDIRAAILPHFGDLIYDVTALKRHALPLRVKYNNNPNSAIDDFLDLVSVSEDEVVWHQFLQALDTRLVSHRRRFVSDEEWSAR